MIHIPSKFFGGLLLLWVACSGGDNNAAHQSAASVNTPDAGYGPDGMAVFRQKCITCHGADGSLGLNGAKDLSKSVLSLEERSNIITHGKNLMTPFGTILSPEEIQAVAKYSQTLKK